VTAIRIPEVVDPPVCVETVPDCLECAKEAVYKQSIGHECGEHDPRWATMCEVFGRMRREDEAFHRRSHEPQLCRGCGRFIKDNFGRDEALTRSCRAGYCTVWYCPSCGHEIASAGPVGCPACGRWKRDARLTRLRSAYRRRRRYW
jgi:hypothetical protein